MSKDFLSQCTTTDHIEAVETFLRAHLQSRQSAIAQYSSPLWESMSYSLLGGGKRFRPVLSLETFIALTGRTRDVVPFAAALEMIHTYSLIHDDLPSMDNDDYRRGQPTNHKKFGEPLALLAGDALLTECFFVLSRHYGGQPTLGELLRVLSEAAGASGMVGGQAMDMELGEPLSSLEAVERVQLGKTAALISASIEGAAVLSGVDTEKQKKLREFGLLLGLCFQIKDDLLDQHQDQSPKSFIHHLGVEGTEKLLVAKSERASELLSALPQGCLALQVFLDFNRQRQE